MSDFSKIIKNFKAVERFVKKDLPKIVVTEAVNRYSENFDKQSFNGKPWKEVKRRDNSSAWYGFKFGAKTKKPAKHPSRKGVAKKYKARKSSPITNYSKAATKTPILSSQRSDN